MKKINEALNVAEKVAGIYGNDKAMNAMLDGIVDFLSSKAGRAFTLKIYRAYGKYLSTCIKIVRSAIPMIMGIIAAHKDEVNESVEEFNNITKGEEFEAASEAAKEAFAPFASRLEKLVK